MSLTCIRLVIRAAVGAVLAGVVLASSLLFSLSASAAENPSLKPRTHSPVIPIFVPGGKKNGGDTGRTPPQIDPGRGNGGGIGVIPGLGVKPRKPIGVVENVVVDNNIPPLATAIVQVLNQNSQWASSRTIVVPHVTKFRWSTSSNKGASARWELFQDYKPQQPQVPGGHSGHPGPSAVLMGYGDLTVPALGTKQEFSIDLAKYLNFQAPANGFDLKLRIVVYDAAKKQIAPGSNHVLLKYLPLKVTVGNYERFQGSFQANEPPIDAMIRATITNLGSAAIEQGLRFEFYAKKGNGSPVKIGDGIVPAIAVGGSQKVIAVRPVDDWHKTDAQSQYTYECKVFAVK